MEEVSARSSTPEVQREGGEYGSKVTGVMTTKKPGDEGGRTDLLLRFFDSSFFNEWIALTYVPNQSTHIYIYIRRRRVLDSHTRIQTHMYAHICACVSHTRARSLSYYILRWKASPPGMRRNRCCDELTRFSGGL